MRAATARAIGVTHEVVEGADAPRAQGRAVAIGRAVSGQTAGVVDGPGKDQLAGIEIYDVHEVGVIRNQHGVGARLKISQQDWCWKPMAGRPRTDISVVS